MIVVVNRTIVILFLSILVCGCMTHFTPRVGELKALNCEEAPFDTRGGGNGSSNNHVRVADLYEVVGQPEMTAQNEFLIRDGSCTFGDDLGTNYINSAGCQAPKSAWIQFFSESSCKASVYAHRKNWLRFILDDNDSAGAKSHVEDIIAFNQSVSIESNKKCLRASITLREKYECNIGPNILNCGYWTGSLETTDC